MEGSRHMDSPHIVNTLDVILPRKRPEEENNRIVEADSAIEERVSIEVAAQGFPIICVLCKMVDALGGRCASSEASFLISDPKNSTFCYLQGDWTLRIHLMETL